MRVLSPKFRLRTVNFASKTLFLTFFRHLKHYFFRFVHSFSRTLPFNHTPLKTSTPTFTSTPTDLCSAKKTVQKPTDHNTMLNAADFTQNDFHSEVETQTKLAAPMLPSTTQSTKSAAVMAPPPTPELAHLTKDITIRV